MEKKNYENLIPPPPKNLVDYMIKKGDFACTDKVVFNAEWRYNPVSQIKERMAKCVCTACHCIFYEKWVSAQDGCEYSQGYGIYDGRETIKNGSCWICPECGAEIKLTHIGSIQPYSMYNPTRFITVFEKIENEFAVVEYCVIKNYFKDGTTEYYVKHWEAYVFHNKTCTKLKGWWNNMGGRTFYPNWHQMSKFSVPSHSCEPDEIYPYEKDLISKTTMQNSKLEKYLTSKKALYPVQYLRYYQHRPKIETILALNLINFVAKELERCNNNYSSKIPFSDLKWTEKSPYKILGVNRAELKIMKKYNWDISWLSTFKDLREKGVLITEENVRLAMNFPMREVIEISNLKESTLKVIRYMLKTSTDKKIPLPINFLKDYWSMAEKLGYNLDNPIVKYPKNLRQAHDKAVQAVKWNESKELIEKFANLYSRLKELSFSNGEICIALAENENELIIEGKLLKHCVGGYGKTHCAGSSIFFVRKASEPQTPWFTLNVELKTGKTMQLHGYDNERSGQTIPQSVYAFIAYWKENIFRKFDVDKMEFIEKPKKPKKGSGSTT